MLGNSVVSTSRRVLSALFIGLALTGTALAQQPLKIGFGMSLTGPLAGKTLDSVPSIAAIWRAWKLAHPDTLVFGDPAR